jgi:hypothetical protein
MFEPRIVVLNIDELSEISEWLGKRYEDILMQSPGKRYHPFDAISRAWATLSSI